MAYTRNCQRKTRLRGRLANNIHVPSIIERETRNEPRYSEPRRDKRLPSLITLFTIGWRRFKFFHVAPNAFKQCCLIAISSCSAYDDRLKSNERGSCCDRVYKNLFLLPSSCKGKFNILLVSYNDLLSNNACESTRGRSYRETGF